MDFRAAWKRARATAGVVGQVLHDMRWNRVRERSGAAVPPHVAMELLGHRTAAMFLRCDVTDVDDESRAVADPEPNGTRPAPGSASSASDGATGTE